MVIDHTSYAVSEAEGDHTLIASDDFIQSDVILGEKKIAVSCRSLPMHLWLAWLCWDFPLSVTLILHWLNRLL